jgi:hypothetical protein
VRQCCLAVCKARNMLQSELPLSVTFHNLRLLRRLCSILHFSSSLFPYPTSFILTCSISLLFSCYLSPSCCQALQYIYLIIVTTFRSHSIIRRMCNVLVKACYHLMLVTVDCFLIDGRIYWTLDTARDCNSQYTHAFQCVQLRLHCRCFVSASNGGCSPSSEYPNCPRAATETGVNQFLTYYTVIYPRILNSSTIFLI